MQVCFLWKNPKTKQRSFNLFNIFLLTTKFFSCLWNFASRKSVVSVEIHQMHINTLEYSNRLIHFWNFDQMFWHIFRVPKPVTGLQKAFVMAQHVFVFFLVRFFLVCRLIFGFCRLTLNQSGFWIQKRKFWSLWKY